jgi:hypothetical protein
MSLVVPPYPPPRFTKEQPEVSATLRRAPESGGAPPDYDSFGLLQYHYLATQQKTDGDYGLYRVDLARRRADQDRTSTGRCRKPSSCCRAR